MQDYFGVCVVYIMYLVCYFGLHLRNLINSRVETNSFLASLYLCAQS
jgi:hypothetical protein